MAVTKRTRFEVLRRDNHTCQYCGAKAPDAVLEIDHVMPVSLGGDDAPGNLITACRGCNMGKASVTPDSPLVAGLSERAAAYALGMQDKMTRFRADFEALEEYEESFLNLWNQWTVVSGEKVPLPSDYQRSLFRWLQIGVPVAAFEVAIPPAMIKRGLRGETAEFSYMAGILTRMLDQREIDLSLTSETVAVYTESEVDEQLVAAHERGVEVGRGIGERNMKLDFMLADFLAHHIDGTTMESKPHPWDRARVLYSGKVVRVGKDQDDKT